MTEKAKNPMQTEFEALPLDQKISQLMKLEVVTLTETFNYVVDSASRAFEKAGETINDFGSKFESEVTKAAATAKAAAKGETKTAAPKATTAKPKARPAKKPSARKE